jgi:dienelactone hydrolase
MISLHTTIYNNSDWDGVNFYEQVRATLMATEHNWVGFAADIYGADLHNVTDMEERRTLATLYRMNATLFAGRIQAAIDTVKTLDQVDPNKIALLGYVIIRESNACFFLSRPT